MILSTLSSFSTSRTAVLLPCSPSNHRIRSCSPSGPSVIRRDGWALRVSRCILLHRWLSRWAAACLETKGPAFQCASWRFLAGARGRSDQARASRTSQWCAHRGVRSSPGSATCPETLVFPGNYPRAELFELSFGEIGCSRRRAYDAFLTWDTWNE